MARKQDGETERRWREILERQAVSSQPIHRFCEVEGISKASFYAWRKRLREHQAEGVPAVRKGAPRQEAGGNAGLFVPLKLLDAPAALEIVHPLGYRIHVTSGVNRALLRHVLEALDERGAG
jgi:hypothetical protein